MSSENVSAPVPDVTLALGQALLDLAVASCPELRGICDMDDDPAHADTQIRETGSAIDIVDNPLVFDYLLREQITFERNFTECGYMVDVPLSNGLIFVTDVDGHVRCFIGAIIDNENGGSLTIEFNPPLVDRLVCGDPQHSLTDRIRVCTYLVRLSCQVVGILSDPLRVSGDPIGFLRNAIRILSELIRTARLEQRDHTSNTTKSTNATDDQIRHCQPVHDDESTQKQKEQP